MAESDNILTKLQDLLVYLIPQLNKFPRDQKFVLGGRIETKLLDVQEDCLRAYYSRDTCPLRAGGMRKSTDFRSVPSESPPYAACFPWVRPGGNEYAGVIGAGSRLARECPDDVA
jgi:hypothetical protein